jgi:hypothetical protein
MVVVVVKIARAATPAMAAGVGFKANGRAIIMGKDCSGSMRWTADRARMAHGSDPPFSVQSSAVTTAFPISLVLTLVVPAL